MYTTIDFWQSKNQILTIFLELFYEFFGRKPLLFYA